MPVVKKRNGGKNSDNNGEAIFYNALNLSGNSGYNQLRKCYAMRGSWENCWRSYGDPGINPENAWANLRDHEINLTLLGEAEYPPLLSEIPNPPLGIYFKGSPEALAGEASIAIVGTRKASESGKSLAKNFAFALAKQDFTVISGLALGIDSAAHSGALEAKRPTVAVLANGLEKIYPAGHWQMANHIIENGGVLLSEYPVGSPPLAYRFLERNRIISGLAKAILAIEVPERSGVISTARFALDQNRDFFVVPGAVHDPNYKGSHQLIRSGATLVTDPNELLKDLGYEPAINDEKTTLDTPEASLVMAVLKSAGKPLTIDEIIEAAKLTSSAANQTLTILILGNKVREEAGRYTFG